MKTTNIFTFNCYFMHAQKKPGFVKVLLHEASEAHCRRISLHVRYTYRCKTEWKSAPKELTRTSQ